MGADTSHVLGVFVTQHFTSLPCAGHGGGRWVWLQPEVARHRECRCTCCPLRRHPDLEALERGVRCLLRKQLSNGDWPQVRADPVPRALLLPWPWAARGQV